MPQHSPVKRGKRQRTSETEIEEFLECFCSLEGSPNVLSYTLSFLEYAGSFTIPYSLIIRKHCPAAAVHVKNGSGMA